MYKSFRIKNFRCFSDLEIDGFQRVNLIAGFNNVGKTALLEAMWLHGARYKPELVTSLSAFRGIGTFTVQIAPGAETLWDSLFAEFDTDEPAEFCAVEKGGTKHTVSLRVLKTQQELSKAGSGIVYGRGAPKRASVDRQASDLLPLTSGPAQVLKMRYRENGKNPQDHYLILDARGFRTEPIPPALPFQSVFLASQFRAQVPDPADLFSNLHLDGRQQILLDALQCVEPRLRNLALLKSGGQTLIHGDIGLARPLPLNVMGEGTLRLATMVLYISTSPKGIVFIDEIENGFHHSILPKVWEVVAKAARDSDAQVFATTHSLECIESAHQAFQESGKYDFRLYRLEKSKSGIRAISFDKKTLSVAIESDMEIR